jgi:hypothetical protein
LRTKGWKRRVQDIDGILGRKEKEQGGEGQREVIPEEQVYQ